MGSIWERDEPIRDEVWVIRLLEQQRDEARAEVKRLRGALEQIAKREGPFSRDPLTHASNCIEHMAQIAESALNGGE